MSLEQIEIFIAPIKMFWFGMPKDFQKKNRVELLKKDILLIDCKIEDIDNLNVDVKAQNSILFFNLNTILPRKIIMDDERIDTEACAMLKKIAENYAKLSIVHTTLLKPKVADFAKKLGILYLEKVVGDTQESIVLIENIAKQFFKANNKQLSNVNLRAFIRIHFAANSLNVTLKKPDLEIPAYINNVSINGMGVTLKDNKDLKYFKLKDFVELKAFLPELIIKVNKSVIRWIGRDKYELGLYFDSKDPNMIDWQNSYNIASLIYNVLGDIIDDMGKDYDLNFLHTNL